MKLYGEVTPVLSSTGRIVLVSKFEPSELNKTFQVTIEVQEAKKTVTKETLPFYVPMRRLPSGQFEYANWREVTFYIPPNAHNEKCTYEIEE